MATLRIVTVLIVTVLMLLAEYDAFVPIVVSAEGSCSLPST
jgi:hypothetical protein